MRSKKGIGTIIGALFFMFVVLGAMTMMSWASRQQGNFSTTSTEVGRLQLERMVSDLQITDVRLVNDAFGISRFSITMQNNGPLTENIVRLWVTNETSSWHNKYDVSYLVGPKQSITVGQELPLVAKDTQSYTFKAVTERGNIVSFKTVSIYEATLKLALSIIPPNVVVGENATIILSVTNDQNDVQAVHNINPILTNSTLNCVIGGVPDCPKVVQKGSNPLPVNSLLRGSTATFKWTANIGGSSSAAGAVVRFTATLPANSISDDLRISQITIGQTNFASQSGTLTIEYESLKWLQNNSCTIPIEEDDWKTGWVIPKQSSGWTAFKIKITNHDPTNDLVLDKRSSFFLTGVSAGINNAYFIVKASQSTCDSNAAPTAYTYDANSGSPTDPNRIIIPHSPEPDTTVPVVVVFAAKSIGGSDNKNLTPEAVYAGNFVMFGKLGSVMYGQNIPFLGVEVTV